AASSALKDLAAGTISRRHSQKVLLPVEIPPVIPIEGIRKIPNIKIRNPKQCSNGQMKKAPNFELSHPREVPNFKHPKANPIRAAFGVSVIAISLELGC